MAKANNKSKSSRKAKGWLDRTSMYGFELFMAAFGLTIAAIAVDYGLFALFNHLQDTREGMAGAGAGSASLFMVAAMLVWLPLALGFYLRSRGEMQYKPERATSSLHKVLVSVYLFVNVFILAGALFTALYSLIRILVGDVDKDVNELLLRMTAPALLMTGLHAWMLYAYSKAGFATRKLFATIFAAFSIVVIGAFLALSVDSVRGANYDEKRVQDLSTINRSINDYYRDNRTLPNSLDDISVNEDRLKLSLSEYTYDRKTGARYELCVDFATDTKVGRDYYTKPDNGDEYSSYGDFYYHGSGRQCFKLTAESRFDMLNDSVR